MKIVLDWDWPYLALLSLQINPTQLSWFASESSRPFVVEARGAGALSGGVFDFELGRSVRGRRAALGSRASALWATQLFQAWQASVCDLKRS